MPGERHLLPALAGLAPPLDRRDRGLRELRPPRPRQRPRGDVGIGRSAAAIRCASSCGSASRSSGSGRTAHSARAHAASRWAIAAATQPEWTTSARSSRTGSARRSAGVAARGGGTRARGPARPRPVRPPAHQATHAAQRRRGEHPPQALRAAAARGHAVPRRGRVRGVRERDDERVVLHPQQRRGARRHAGGEARARKLDEQLRRPRRGRACGGRPRRSRAAARPRPTGRRRASRRTPRGPPRSPRRTSRRAARAPPPGRCGASRSSSAPALGALAAPPRPRRRRRAADEGPARCPLGEPAPERAGRGADRRVQRRVPRGMVEQRRDELRRRPQPALGDQLQPLRQQRRERALEHHPQPRRPAPAGGRRRPRARRPRRAARRPPRAPRDGPRRRRTQQPLLGLPRGEQIAQPGR